MPASTGADVSTQFARNHSPTAHRVVTEYLTDTFLGGVLPVPAHGRHETELERCGPHPRPRGSGGIRHRGAGPARQVRGPQERPRRRVSAGTRPAASTRPPERTSPSLLEHELTITPVDVRGVLEALVGLGGHGPAFTENVLTRTSGAAATTQGGLVRRWSRWGHRGARPVRRVLVPLLLLNGIIAATMAVGPVLHVLFDAPLPAAGALEARRVWLRGSGRSTFIPGWLLVRFLDRRAGALWDEYVIHLHRLGVDRPGSLPEPPADVDVLRPRGERTAASLDGGCGNIYQQEVRRVLRQVGLPV